MAGKKIDTVLAKESFAKLSKLNDLQKTEDGKLFPLMENVGVWWTGKSADALESRASRMYQSVKAIREDTSLDLTQSLTYVAALIAKDRQYANKLAAFGSGNSIAKNAGTVGQGASKGMESMEFKNWLSRVTGVAADTSALTEYFSKSGHTLEEIYWIWLGLTGNGVTETHIANLQKIGYSFDDVVTDYSRITKITDKKIYSYLLKGGDYFNDLEGRKPGSWKGMLTGITAGGELEQSTKIALIDVKEGIGAYYRNKYNTSSYAKTGDTAINKATPNEKILFNLCFEAANPRFSASIDTFFAQAGEEAKKYTEQIRDIKFIAYSAPLSYQTVFLNQIDKIGIATLNHKGTQYYSPLSNKLYINLREAKTTESGPYQTFFHECGHAIDDRLKWIGTISSSYEVNGKTLKTAMVEDAENWIEMRIKDICSPTGTYSGVVLSEKQKTNIIHNLIIWSRDQAERNNGCVLNTQDEQNIRDEVVRVFIGNQDIKSEVGGIASDIYGGLSGNVLKGYHGHIDKSYWYREFQSSGWSQYGLGETVTYIDTGMLSTEYFAENFAAVMVGDQPSINCEETYLGETKKIADAIITEASAK